MYMGDLLSNLVRYSFVQQKHGWKDGTRVAAILMPNDNDKVYIHVGRDTDFLYPGGVK